MRGSLLPFRLAPVGFGRGPSVRPISLSRMPKSVTQRPLMVVRSPGHIDRFGERVPDKWAVVRVSNGHIVRLFTTEPEAREFASERNATWLLGAR